MDPSVQPTGEKPGKAMSAPMVRLNHKWLSGEIRARRTTLECEGLCKLKTIYCSSTPFRNLKIIAITDIRINVPAKGYYLILRSLEEPCRDNGIITVVEDHKGNVFGINIHNLVRPKLEETPSDVIPVATVFIVKEPLLLDDYLIRCNSPSDVIIVAIHHKLYKMFKNIAWKHKPVKYRKKLPTSSEGWKHEGNEYFKEQRHILALDSYLMALYLIKPEESQLKMTLHLNISATYLALQHYEMALEYALTTLTEVPGNTKALYRAGRAHYLLRQFSDAEKYFNKLLEVDGDNIEGKRQMIACKKRLVESSKGCSIFELYQAKKNVPRTRIDCADYIGPLKIRKNPVNCRSVVATRDIKPGTLLVVSKALIMEFEDEYFSEEFYHYNVKEKAIRELTQLVIKNPNTIGAAVYDLPINDCFQNSIAPKRFCHKSSKEEPVADVQRIRQITISNGVAIDPTDDTSSIGLLDDEITGCAFFLFPSYFTHSCMPNADWVLYNDVMVIHAVRDIKKGETVTISFINPMMCFSEKENVFLDREMKCVCAFCESNRAEPEKIRNKREILTSKVKDMFMEIVRTQKMKPEHLKFFNFSTKKIEDLYLASGRDEYMFDLAFSYTSLVMSYSFNLRTMCDVTVNSKKGLIYVWKALSVLGFDAEVIRSWGDGPEHFSVPPKAMLNKLTLDLIAFLIPFYEMLGKSSEASFYMRCLSVGHTVMTGANAKMTKFSFSSIPEDMKLQE